MAENIVKENVINTEIENEMNVEKVNEADVEVIDTESVEVEIKDPITLDEFKKTVKIIKYVSTQVKRLIIETVKTNCVYTQNDMYYIDYINKETAFNLSILNFYTDFVSDEINTYNHLDSIGVFDYIRSEIRETLSLYCVVDKEVKQMVDNYNSTGAVVSRTLGDFVNKIPDISNLLEALPKTLNKVNPEVLKVFAKEFKNGTIPNQVIDKDNKVIDIVETSNKKDTDKKRKRNN